MKEKTIGKSIFHAILNMAIQVCICMMMAKVKNIGGKYGFILL